MEAIGVVGQTILDAVESKKSWNPESNRYSRCYNPEVLMPLIATHLTQTEIFLLFTLIQQMNSENKVGSKILKQLDMNRITLWRSKQKLEDKYCIFEFPDGSIMVNPNIAMLSKYRKFCLTVQSVWKTAMKSVVNQEKELKE
jgi:hypothetical protein